MTSQIHFLNRAKSAKSKPESLIAFSSRLDFSKIINNCNGKYEEGLLVARDGNYAFQSTINYLGSSLVLRYKTRFYSDGQSVVLNHANEWFSNSVVINGIVRPICENGVFDEFMNFIFNIENIKAQCKTKYAKDKTMKYLKSMIGYYLPNNLHHKAIAWIDKQI